MVGDAGMTSRVWLVAPSRVGGGSRAKPAVLANVKVNGARCSRNFANL